jgi:hypothetical protein
MRVILVVAAISGVLLTAESVRADPNAVIGVNDARFGTDSSFSARASRLRIRDSSSRCWHRGESEPERDPLAAAPARSRIVAVVYGVAADAPRSIDDIDRYCNYAAAVVRRHPGVVAVQIWNEPNIWVWQLDPTTYATMLQHCAPSLHALGVNILRPGLRPSAPTREWTDAIRAVSAAAAGRGPLLDGWAYHPYYGYSPADTPSPCLGAGVGAARAAHADPESRAQAVVANRGWSRRSTTPQSGLSTSVRSLSRSTLAASASKQIALHS